LTGFGITRNWDFGVIFPLVVTAQNEDPYGVSYFDKFGLTEIRPMTKFRFYGDNTGGLAIQLSANFRCWPAALSLPLRGFNERPEGQPT